MNSGTFKVFHHVINRVLEFSSARTLTWLLVVLLRLPQGLFQLADDIGSVLQHRSHLCDSRRKESQENVTHALPSLRISTTLINRLQTVLQHALFLMACGDRDVIQLHFDQFVLHAGEFSGSRCHVLLKQDLWDKFKEKYPAWSGCREKPKVKTIWRYGSHDTSYVCI